MFDVALVVGAAVAQLIVTWYAVHISVRKHQIRIAIVIGVVGAVGIFFTGWAALRASKTQDELNSKVFGLGKQLEAIQGTISNNTNASIAIWRFDEPQELIPGTDMWFHVRYEVEDNTAKNIRYHHEVFSMAGTFTQERVRKAFEEFKTRSVKYLDYQGETLVIGSTSDAVLSLKLTEQEIWELSHPLSNPARNIYFMTRVEWDNPSGSHDGFSNCRVISPPSEKIITGRIGWHPCFH